MQRKIAESAKKCGDGKKKKSAESAKKGKIAEMAKTLLSRQKKGVESAKKVQNLQKKCRVGKKVQV
jgi:hypothetical protein